MPIKTSPTAAIKSVFQTAQGGREQRVKRGRVERERGREGGREGGREREGEREREREGERESFSKKLRVSLPESFSMNLRVSLPVEYHSLIDVRSSKVQDHFNFI